jgi:hypothetical protein
VCLLQIPLHVYSYKDLYGWTMDEIVSQIGTRSNCTFCGVFRRQVRLAGCPCRRLPAPALLAGLQAWGGDGLWIAVDLLAGTSTLGCR